VFDKLKKKDIKILLGSFISIIALLIVIGTLVAIILIGWNFYRDLFGKVSDVTVPSVINIDIVEAQKKIKESGLDIEIQQKYSDTVPKDMIFLQKPDGGRKVKAGRKVFVTVSLGGELVTVPILKGMASRDAEIKLTELGLKYIVEKEQTHETLKKGMIVEQNPVPLSQVPRNTTVQVILSSGPAVPADVPDLIGLPLADARAAIENTGFLVGKIVWIEDTRFKPGMVLTQVPSAKEKIKTGSLISLEVTVDKYPENKVFFQQDLLTITVPKSDKDVEVDVIVTDRFSRSKVYHAFHKGGEKIQLSVSSLGNGKVEILFNGVLEARADLTQ
jgi:eukaryotic-like serine/threonine-protein kinase